MTAGQHLLAHELTHVVQQRTGSLGTSSGGSGGTLTVGAADDRHEQEAEATAQRVVAALQARGPALTAPATSPGAALSRQYDPALALIVAPVGVARATAPTPRAAKDRPTPPGSPSLPLRTPPYAFVLADAANLHAVAPTPGDTLAAAPVIGQLPVTAKLQVLQADPARDRALVRVLAAPAAAKARVGTEGWVRLSFLDARGPAGDPDATLYVIRGGDTALGLAARFYGLPASAHPEQDADLRRYVQALVLANRAPACWIDRPNPANPLDWMRAQVNANARLWVPTRAKADALAATVRSPSLTGGAWATVARGLGWAEAHLLQGASLYAQDVVVLADAAASAMTGATRYAIMIGGAAVAVAARTAHAAQTVLQAVATAALAPAVLMARLGAFAAQKLADVPGALLALLERKAQEVLTALLGPQLVKQLGGAVQAILADPGTFIGNLGKALGTAVTFLLDHVRTNWGQDLLQWLVGKVGAAIPLPTGLDLSHLGPQTLLQLIPTVQAILGLTEAHVRGLIVAQLAQAERITPGVAAQRLATVEGRVGRLSDLAQRAWATVAGGTAAQAAQHLVGTTLDNLRGWVMQSVIAAAVTKVAQLCAPLVGQIIGALQAIYGLVQTVLENKDTLRSAFDTIVGQFAQLAAHKDAAVAVGIGKGIIGPKLVTLIPAALSFLAKLLGLGNVQHAIEHSLKPIQDAVDRALKTVIGGVVRTVRGLLHGHGGATTGAGSGAGQQHQENPKHAAIAQAIVAKLEHIDGAPKDFAATRTEKESEAGPLKARYQPQLEKGINLSITFATKPDDAGGKETLDFTVVIAPNTTKLSGRILVAAPGTPPTHVTYQTLSGNRAHWVHALPLTLAPGNTKGSSPHQNPPGWGQVVIFDHDVVNDKRTPPVYGPLYWKQLHLLSEMFHGPGKVWNLMPGRGADNDWMTGHPEQDVKNAFGAESHATLSYRTEATYFTTSDGDNNPANAARRVTIENFVKSIHIEWFHVKQEHGSWVKDTSRPTSTYEHSMIRPPLLLPLPGTVRAIDINTVGWKSLYNPPLRLGRQLSEDIVAVRDKDLYVTPGASNGRFISESNLRDRMDEFYKQKGVRDFLTRSTLWPALEEAIKSGQAAL